MSTVQTIADAGSQIELVELVGDDDNLAVLAPTETLLANLTRDEPIGLELAGERRDGLPVVRTLLRVSSPALLGPAVLVALVAARLRRSAPTYDPTLVREKLAQRAFYIVQLRLAVIGPATATAAAVTAALDRLADAYGADQPLGAAGAGDAWCSVRRIS
jgi:hypothetical protein